MPTDDRPPILKTIDELLRTAVQELEFAQLDHQLVKSDKSDRALAAAEGRVAQLQASRANIVRKLTGEAEEVIARREAAADKRLEVAAETVSRNQVANHKDAVTLERILLEQVAPILDRVHARNCENHPHVVEFGLQLATKQMDDAATLAGGENAFATLQGTEGVNAALAGMLYRIGFGVRGFRFDHMLGTRIDEPTVADAIARNEQHRVHIINRVRQLRLKSRLQRKQRLRGLREDLKDVPARGQRGRQDRILGEIDFLEQQG